MASSMVCDSNTASLDYQEQKTFFSNHPSSWRIVLKDILVELFEPENLYSSAIEMQNKETLKEKKTKKQKKKLFWKHIATYIH
jgi:hypothetical protein